MITVLRHLSRFSLYEKTVSSNGPCRVILKVSLSKQAQLLLEWISVSLSVCDASPDVFVHMHLRYKCTRGPNRVRIRHVLTHVQMLTNVFACVVRIKETQDKMTMAKARVAATCTAAGH